MVLKISTFRGALQADKKLATLSIQQFIKDYGFKGLKRVERMIRRHSLVGDHTFFDLSDFPWVSQLEAGSPLIRKEVDAILEHRDLLPRFQDISKDQLVLTKDDKWKTFFLYGYGYKSEKNCARCPETTRILEQIPGMMTAFFSILAPGKHIPDHEGPYNGVLRCHLGLKIPEPKTQCRIRVQDEIRHWEEGKAMIFDDTYNHEVWNDTQGERVVLFLDIIRPLPAPVSWFNQFVLKSVALSPLIQEAKRNFEHWEQLMEEAVLPS